eukprot:3027350-Heterocapsa_arctica.AAC.1
MSMLPSTGSLSVEEVCERIHYIEEDMRDICVRMANPEQRLNLATNSHLDKCTSSGKKIRCACRRWGGFDP